MTRPDPIAAAAESLAEAELGIRRGTVEEAARRAYTPTGPPLEELERRIREVRANDAARTVTKRRSA